MQDTSGDYSDHFNTIGCTHLGTPSHPRATAVLMGDGPGGSVSVWVEEAALAEMGIVL